MVIDEINVVHVASFKPKGESPVASNRNAPQSSSVPSEWMQSVSWQIKIARLAGGIQVCQGESDSVQLVGGYPAGVVSPKEPPQPSMAKRTDHALIIPCAGTAINRSFNPESTEQGGAEREIRDMEERLSGRFWTVGAGERLATVMWSSPARDRTSRRRSLAGLGRVWVTLG